MARVLNRTAHNQRTTFGVLLAAATLVLSCGQEDDVAKPFDGDEDIEAVCVDEDEDGYGRGCDKGRDCDDDDPEVTNSCPVASCASSPTAPGCECSEEDQGVAIDCGEVYEHVGDSVICGYGVQLCDEGKWGACKFSSIPANQVVQPLAVSGPCASNPCDPNCREFAENQNYSTPEGSSECALEPSCQDGEQNNGELGIDCEGPCAKACPPAPIVVSADFNYGFSGFAYSDDLFNGTSAPGSSSGALAGGYATLNMGILTGSGPNSGGFAKTFASEGAVDVTLEWVIDVPDSYQSDECAQAIVMVDGVRYGDGGNNYIAEVCDGGTQSGTFTFSTNFLTTGDHTLTIGGFLTGNDGGVTSTRLQVEDYLGYYNPSASGNDGGRGGHNGFETSSDTDGTLNMGWTDSGDWVEWEYNAPVDGNYSINARVAGGSGAWSHNYLVDGAVVAAVNGTNTGGWQTWKTFTTSTFNLSAGSHIIRLSTTSPDQNINWIDILEPAVGEQVAVRFDNVIVYAQGGPRCGDAVCESIENCSNCASDCGDCPLGSYCGDATCDPGANENCSNCATDCGICAIDCGDGVCSGVESCGNCETDCGQCLSSAYCGDSVCGMGENCLNCESDCGVCRCGDSVCDASQGEDCSTCALDCGLCAAEEGCGDAICDPGLSETCSTCRTDCGDCPEVGCGDATCAMGEDCNSCLTDCGGCAPSQCGNATCNSGETCDACAIDCGACAECGDGTCDAAEGEDCTTCMTDCGTCPATPVLCGNNTCDSGSGENCSTCAKDCGACGGTWSGQDVGTVNAAGSFTQSGTSFTVRGSGADIYSNSDEFHYVYRQISGDVTIVARVDSVQNTHEWAKAAVMIRESLSGNSEMALIARRPDGGLQAQYRTSTGGTATDSGSPTAHGNTWLKVERIGTQFKTYYSYDGVIYNQLGSTTTINMNSSVYVGLVALSHNDGTLATMQFSNVSITQAAYCGDATCSGSETCNTCETDCGGCSATMCGDDVCNGSEDCSTCAADCGACPTCGNGTCDISNGESCTSCETDCGHCSATQTATVWLEAECGRTESGNYIYNLTSKGGYVGAGYVETATEQTTAGSNPDRATYKFSVSAGTYTFWFRANTNNSYIDDSWFYRIGDANGGNFSSWTLNNNVYASGWLWYGGGIVTSGSPVTHYLNAGTYTLEVSGRENGLALDRIYITKNGDTPSGNGGTAYNCAGLQTCGDNFCDGAAGETCSTCAKDCGPCAQPAACGDATCNGPSETCDTCTTDCGECTELGDCGDMTCDASDGEDCDTCAMDCGACDGPAECGDATCDEAEGETCSTCESDCGACTPTCGDGYCVPGDGEDCDSCAMDCGACDFVGCGDEVCDAGDGENCATCATDCGACLGAVCGDAICDPDRESCVSCQSDCGGCPVSGCGDALCSAAEGESCSTCVSDCGVCETGDCGNGTCGPGETCGNCAIDCGACAECGDATCDSGSGETCSTCKTDCGDCAVGTPTEVWLEAECATTKAGGYTTTHTSDAGYGGSGYIETATTNTTAGSNPDRATYTFNIQSGTYTVYFRVDTNSSADDDSWFWRIDGGSWRTNNNHSTSSFAWFAGDGSAVTLSTGSHTLEVYGRENGLKIDRIAIKASGLPSGVGTAASNCSAPTSCGNLTCEAGSGETCSTCAKDCGACAQPPECGDASCDGGDGENCSTCESDCGSCPVVANCGNGMCGAGETCANCAIDCGVCESCGNASCNSGSGESCSTCQSDCGGCAATPSSEIWLEAECPKSSTGAYKTPLNAQGGFVGTGYIQSVGDQTIGGDAAADTALYEFVTTSGVFKVFFRVDTNASYGDDSWYWRIDGGSWRMNNNQYPSSSFAWLQGTTSENSPATISLSEGTHTLEIANRENGLAFDRMVITTGSIPSGDGGTATNCGASSSSCGNGYCDNGENCGSCAIDCGACDVVQCGDATCEGNENCANCASDCGSCGGTQNCGNDTCDAGENCTNCATDCGACEASACGNDVCDEMAGEDCLTCATDCGPCSLTATCSDGVCEEGEEDCITCASDCGTCLSSDTCGDDSCDSYEDCSTCATDCGACSTCGNGTCDTADGETCGSCATDCGACVDRSVCGDGTCDTDEGEDCSSCATDCTACPIGSYCGDDSCDTADGETCSSCATDCDPCETSVCGDGTCEAEEDCTVCPEDCGECIPMCPAPPPPPVVCGDAACVSAEGENCTTCATDCGECPAGDVPNCGNGACNYDEGEACDTCPEDCGACTAVRECGDGICEPSIGESCGPSSCGADCGSCKSQATTTCGDGTCHHYETCGICPSDCGACPTSGTGLPFNGGVIATGTVTIGSRVTIHGDVAGKTLGFQPDVKIYGDVDVDGPAALADRAIVSGTLRVDGSLSLGNGSSYGAVESPAAVTLPILPTVTANPGSTNKTIPTDTTATITPGRYNNVLVGARSTVTFTAGRYDMRNIKIEPDATVVIDTSGGPVEWYVSTSIEFESRTQYVVSNGGLWGVYSAGDIVVRPDVKFPASLYAPTGKVTIYSRHGMQAGIAARDVQIEPDVEMGVGQWNVGWGDTEPPPDPATPVCGDGYCTPETGESCSNCQSDCGGCETLPYCGDMSCDANQAESCENCSTDCGTCPVVPACGDGICDVSDGEDCATCAIDCGACAIAAYCGDGTCDAADGETCGTCPADCGTGCYEAIGYEEDYDISEECEFFQVPVWAAFSWEVVTPDDAYIEIYFRSADTPAELDSAPETKIVVAANSAATGGWRYGPPSESAAMTTGFQYVDDVLKEEELPRSRPYARLRYWLVPTSDKTQPATLVRTTLQSTCETNE